MQGFRINTKASLLGLAECWLASSHSSCSEGTDSNKFWPTTVHSEDRMLLAYYGILVFAIAIVFSGSLSVLHFCRSDGSLRVR